MPKTHPAPTDSTVRSSRRKRSQTQTPETLPTVETQAETLRQLIQPADAILEGIDLPGGTTPQALDTREIFLRALDTRQSNVRKSMDPVDLAALQTSVQRHGMLEPVIVQPILGKQRGFQYRLIAGFRRAAAAQALGWESIPARIIQRSLDAQEIVALQLTENLQRETMHIRDIIHAVDGLRNVGQGFQQIAEALGLGESTVRLYANVGSVLKRNPRLWPYFDRGLLSIQHFRVASRIIQKSRERAGQITQDASEREAILAQAETVFVAMLERLAHTQPLTIKRVSAEVSTLLKRAGLENTNPAPTITPPPTQIIPAVLTGYEHLDIMQFDATTLERLISISERQLDAARARLDYLAQQT